MAAKLHPLEPGLGLLLYRSVFFLRVASATQHSSANTLLSFASPNHPRRIGADEPYLQHLDSASLGSFDFLALFYIEVRLPPSLAMMSSAVCFPVSAACPWLQTTQGPSCTRSAAVEIDGRAWATTASLAMPDC